MVVRTGITCRHQIQQNKNTEHSIHELKCIAMCLPPSGRWEQGDLEQLLGGWEQVEAIWSSSWADGNKRRRMGTGRAGAVDLADGPPPGRRGWLEGRGAGHHLQAPPRLGWDGAVSPPCARMQRGRRGLADGCGPATRRRGVGGRSKQGHISIFM